MIFFDNIPITNESATATRASNSVEYSKNELCRSSNGQLSD